MQRPNRTHANPGISIGQAKAVQDKAKAMGLGGTTRLAGAGDEETSKAAGTGQKPISVDHETGQNEITAKNGQSDSHADA